MLIKWFLSILIRCFSSKLILALNKGMLAYVLNLLIFAQGGLGKVKTAVHQHAIYCKMESRLSTITYLLVFFYYPSKTKVLQTEILKGGGFFLSLLLSLIYLLTKQSYILSHHLWWLNLKAEIFHKHFVNGTWWLAITWLKICWTFSAPDVVCWNSLRRWIHELVNKAKN